jgi:hypothetical protein
MPPGEAAPPRSADLPDQGVLRVEPVERAKLLEVRATARSEAVNKWTNLWTRFQGWYVMRVLVRSANDPGLALWALQAHLDGKITQHEMVRRIKQAHGTKGKL